MLFISLSPKLNLDLFSIYDFNNRDYYALFQPNLILSERLKDFRIYLNGGYYYLRQKQSYEDEWKLYQLYLKFYKRRFEIKTGKIVFIPGFLGIFNPFFKGLNFETISTIYEGNNGIFLRYNHFISPTIFIFEENSFKSVKAIFQLENNLGKFTNGLYMHFKEKTGLGFFTGYFSNYTFKLSLLKEEYNLKINALMKKRIKSLIFDINLYWSEKGEFLPLPGFYLNSKLVGSLEVKFPERIFEIPYIMLIYDYSNKIPLILLDYKYIFGNNLSFEIGGISYLKSTKGYFLVYAGIKFLKVF